MISFVLGVEDLADTRFAVSPLQETVLSLRVLRDPGQSALHLPWRRSVLPGLGTLDTELLMSLIGKRHILPDFLTPRPTRFAPAFEDELAIARQSSPDLIRRDLLATHTRLARSPNLCTPPPPPTPTPTRGSSVSATPSANSWVSTGNSPSSRCGRRYDSHWKPI